LQRRGVAWQWRGFWEFFKYRVLRRRREIELEGTTMNISNAFTGLASFTAQAGQTGVTTYGGRVGLNYMIN
jgi:hypothetical protein